MNLKKIFSKSQPFIIGVACALIITGWLPEVRRYFQFEKKQQTPINQIVSNNSFSHIVTPVLPSIVTIYSTSIVESTVQPLFSDPLFNQQYLKNSPSQFRKKSNIGSGTIIQENGYILTNYHIIEDTESITVVLADARETKAEIIGVDRETDLAVLKIHLSDLTPISIVENEQLNVGDIVFSIGNPYGLGQSVTMGILSATGRSQIGLASYENYLQTDAAINPGSSGGALINANGNLIGINTGNFTDSGHSQGIGFAIPNDIALDAAKQIIENGQVTRGYLGIFNTKVLSVSESQKLGIDFYAFKINHLQKNGPAHLAGVMKGDIWVQIEGEPIINPANVKDKIAKLTPGTPLNIQVLRGENLIDIVIIIGSKPIQIPS